MSWEQLLASPVVALAASAVMLAAVVMGRRIDLKIGKVHAELRPNGGSSYHDKAEERHKTFREEVVGMVSECQSRIVELDERVGRLEGGGGKVGDRPTE